MLLLRDRIDSMGNMELQQFFRGGDSKDQREQYTANQMAKKIKEKFGGHIYRNTDVRYANGRYHIKFNGKSMNNINEFGAYIDSIGGKDYVNSKLDTKTYVPSSGGGGAREGAVGNDPGGWGGRDTSSSTGGLSFGDAVGNINAGTNIGSSGTVDTAGRGSDFGGSFGSAVGNINAGTDVQSSGTVGLSGGVSITGDRLSFKNVALQRMTADIGNFSTMARGGFEDGGFNAGALADEFSSKFGDIGSYAQFQEVTGEYGIDTLSQEDFSKLTSGEAQDYIDQMAEQTTQSFTALQKKSILENIADLETMQRKQLGRIAETYDPETATLAERMNYNASVKGLQAVGMGKEFQTDIRMGDYAKLGMGALSALTGNPMGIASMAMNLKKMGNVNYTAMGELSKYGKFQDPSLKGVNLSDAKLNELGRMKDDISDFATTVRTAEDNIELDRQLTAYTRSRNDYERVLSEQIGSIERKEQVEQETEREDTAQSQGGTEVSNTGKRGLQFNRDVSNKGLGDVISVFDQITTEDEEERLRRQTSARARLGLAGIWRG